MNRSQTGMTWVGLIILEGDIETTLGLIALYSDCAPSSLPYWPTLTLYFCSSPVLHLFLLHHHNATFWVEEKCSRLELWRLLLHCRLF